MDWEMVHYIDEKGIVHNTPGFAMILPGGLNRRGRISIVRQQGGVKTMKKYGIIGEMFLESFMNEPFLLFPAKETRDKYCWENRKIMSNVFISFDGSRYGIPW
ncbi:MAG: hypothetical protein M0R50_08865 [Candidatus Cloacimonetes bacterium]|jgi:hypothetical protein|nr:hypothetical protein [Candidatus Cloacimonadota bacterium]